jgi:serine/threonine-protein kinase
MTDVLTHLFNALNLLWTQNIVHRDLKPANILLKQDFTPVVIDLGIAKIETPEATAITSPFFRSPCTPQYAAPEQLIGAGDEVTYKADQFAVGVIAYQVLTGHFPYGSYADSGEEELMQNFRDEKPLPIRTYVPEISEALERIILRLLAVQPYQRYRTARQILCELTEARTSR